MRRRKFQMLLKLEISPDIERHAIAEKRCRENGIQATIVRVKEAILQQKPTTQICQTSVSSREARPRSVIFRSTRSECRDIRHLHKRFPNNLDRVRPCCCQKNAERVTQ